MEEGAALSNRHMSSRRASDDDLCFSCSGRRVAVIKELLRITKEGGQVTREHARGVSYEGL